MSEIKPEQSDVTNYGSHLFMVDVDMGTDVQKEVFLHMQEVACPASAGEPYPYSSGVPIAKMVIPNKTLAEGYGFFSTIIKAYAYEINPDGTTNNDMAYICNINDQTGTNRSVTIERSNANEISLRVFIYAELSEMKEEKDALDTYYYKNDIVVPSNGSIDVTFDSSFTRVNDRITEGDPALVIPYMWTHTNNYSAQSAGFGYCLSLGIYNTYENGSNVIRIYNEYSEDVAVSVVARA